MEAPPERLQRWIPVGTPLYRAVGCPDCSMTGYRGRMAITEVLITSAEVERRIAANDTVERIADAAREGGMKSLWESGVMHVRAGETTLDELIRVCEIPSEGGARLSGSMPAVSPHPSGNGNGAGRNSGGHAARSSTPVMHSTPASASTLSHFHDEPAFQLIEEVAAPARRIAVHTVLLVEDEEPLRRVLKDLLERDGFSVVEAKDGVEALDQVDRVGPDLVVLDLNLPRLDGFAVLTHLRARQATANLPVLVLTAKGDEDNEVRVFEYGASDFLTKPFRPRALSARLHAMLRR